MPRRGRKKATYQIFASILAAIVAIGTPTLVEAMIPTKGKPVQPSEKIVAQLDALANQFKAQNSGYSCYPLDGGAELEDVNCFLALSCSFGIVEFRKNAAQGFGINFGGDHFLKDPACLTKLFFSQIESLLEVFGNLETTRVREIVSTMEKNPKIYGNCHPERMGGFPEGSGCMNYAHDDEYYSPNFTEGRRILKIFLWQAKKK